MGEGPRLCAGCGGYAYSGAPDCAECRDLVDGLLIEPWQEFLAFMGAGAGEERDIAEMVSQEPNRHDWRVLDAAMDRLSCVECAGVYSRGPKDCSTCNLAHGFRYAAMETDRPGVPPGNEHAIRVNVSVVRRPHITSAQELLVRRLALPGLLAGLLPSIAEAQRISALIKRTPADQQAAVLERLLGSIWISPENS
ncbi:hypothetical protein D5S17_25840 [Pseudonocardiaceae bacterium YIM PH 21723]|nr:hypothetical protein D5S17_25840 [Pseudonocardiaceae bacterium YIM PH 21723]